MIVLKTDKEIDQMKKAGALAHARGNQPQHGDDGHQLHGRDEAGVPRPEPRRSALARAARNGVTAGN